MGQRAREQENKKGLKSGCRVTEVKTEKKLRSMATRERSNAPVNTRPQTHLERRRGSYASHAIS
jgi:hypothetical protein